MRCVGASVFFSVFVFYISSQGRNPCGLILSNDVYFPLTDEHMVGRGLNSPPCLHVNPPAKVRVRVGKFTNEMSILQTDGRARGDWYVVRTVCNARRNAVVEIVLIQAIN